MKDNKKLVIVGAGETGNLAHYYFDTDSNYEVVAFSEEKAFIKKDKYQGLPLVPFEEIERSYPPEEYAVFVAAGSAELSKLRTRLYLECKKRGYTMASYISSKAFVGGHTTIGDNCFILEDNTIQPFVKIGNNVTMWSGNHVGHQSEIGDHCFITSHVVISGYVKIGRNCFIGVNSSIANNLEIGDYCLIGLGSIIPKSLEPFSIVKASYAKKQVINTKQFCHLDI